MIAWQSRQEKPSKLNHTATSQLIKRSVGIFHERQTSVSVIRPRIIIHNRVSHRSTLCARIIHNRVHVLSRRSTLCVWGHQVRASTLCLRARIVPLPELISSLALLLRSTGGATCRGATCSIRVALPTTSSIRLALPTTCSFLVALPTWLPRPVPGSEPGEALLWPNESVRLDGLAARVFMIPVGSSCAQLLH